MKYTNHVVECPLCHGSGYKQNREGRNMFSCTECGYETYLKLISQQTANNENISASSQSVVLHVQNRRVAQLTLF